MPLADLAADSAAAITRLMVRIYHLASTAGQDEELGSGRIRSRLKLSQMLALTHGLLASGNVVKTALYSWNPTALNYARGPGSLDPGQSSN